MNICVQSDSCRSQILIMDLIVSKCHCTIRSLGEYTRNRMHCLKSAYLVMYDHFCMFVRGACRHDGNIKGARRSNAKLSEIH